MAYIGDTVERGMFYGAKPHIFQKAEQLRNNMTPSEEIIWNVLRNKRMMNFRFKAQHPIDIFIADFYCHELKLVIEIDGEIHKAWEQRKYDIGRTAELEDFDIKVVRFENDKILGDITHVAKEIVEICKSRKQELFG